MGEIPRAEIDATPRIGYSGSVRRGKAIWSQTGGSPEWKVEVVPLEGATDGRPLNGGGQRPRATFEVRAEFRGRGLEAFEPVTGGVHRVEQWNAGDDQELAMAMAIATVDELRAGREPVMVQLAARFGQGR